MTHIYASIALGTAATLTAMTLLLLRVSLQRRYVMALTRRWSGARPGASVLVLATLAAIAACSFASIQLTASSIDDGAQTFGPLAGTSGSQALQSLKAYSEKIDDQKTPPHAAAQNNGADALPAVDVMVAKLIARLKDQPNDVAGWKMLGWSYLNTNRAAEAVEAYQTVLKLQPGDTEAEKALAAAKSQMSGEPTSNANTTAVANAELDESQSAMIRGMVDRLATRLETAPDDEEGWLQLMRSRVVQGEQDAAKSALSKALATFKTNARVSDRLIAVARELGIEVPTVQ